MLAVIEQLIALQERDRRLLRLQGELAHVAPERQMHTAKLSKSTTDLETAKLRVKTIESERKRLELEADGKKLQINRYASQQLETRKNEEYKALANEILTCQREINALEDQQLELMEQAEAAQKQVASATQVAKDARRMVDILLKDLDAKEAKLKAELSEVMAAREKLSAEVEETALARYERLLKSKGSNVIVGVQHRACGGCHMKLPTQLILHCQAGQDLVVCSNCGRLLYFTPDMDLAFAD